MTRQLRYKQAMFWRGFIAKSRKIKDEEEMKTFLISVTEVETIQIEHGWTTWVTVKLKNGGTFVDYKSLAIDSMKSICESIYRHVVGEYLTYINAVKGERKLLN